MAWYGPMLVPHRHEPRPTTCMRPSMRTFARRRLWCLALLRTHGGTTEGGDISKVEGQLVSAQSPEERVNLNARLLELEKQKTALVDFLLKQAQGVTPSEALGQALPDILLDETPQPSSSSQTTTFEYSPEHVLPWLSANLDHPANDDGGLEQAVIKVHDDANAMYKSVKLLPSLPAELGTARNSEAAYASNWQAFVADPHNLLLRSNVSDPHLAPRWEQQTPQYILQSAQSYPFKERGADATVVATGPGPAAAPAAVAPVLLLALLWCRAFGGEPSACQPAFVLIAV